MLVTELVDGVTLHDRMNEALTPAAAVEIAIQIARGLAAAHAVGVVHRDVKPQNVMVRSDGLAKLLDFGIAKSLSSAGNQTETPGKILGTVAYMSPEQARGLPVDARTDVWSLGVILYQLLTGETPFRGSSPTDTLAAILLRDPEPPSRHRKDLPPELDRVVARALAKDRVQRFADGAAFAAHLERLRETLNAPTATSARLPLRRWRALARPPTAARAAVVAAVFGVAVTALLALSPTTRTPCAPIASSQPGTTSRGVTRKRSSRRE